MREILNSFEHRNLNDDEVERIIDEFNNDEQYIKDFIENINDGMKDFLALGRTKKDRRNRKKFNDIQINKIIEGFNECIKNYELFIEDDIVKYKLK